MRSVFKPISADTCALLDAADRVIAESRAAVSERHRLREQWNKYLKDGPEKRGLPHIADRYCP